MLRWLKVLWQSDPPMLQARPTSTRWQPYYVETPHRMPDGQIVAERFVYWRLRPTGSYEYRLASEDESSKLYFELIDPYR